MIAFIQPFSTRDVSGGGRILLSLLEAEHPPVLLISTSSHRSADAPANGEIRLPLRSGFGRLERTRFSSYLGIFDRFGSSRFAENLRKVLREHRVKAVHLLHQSYDVVPISRIVREMNIPLFLSIHDDFEYALRGHPCLDEIAQAVGCAWRDAKAVFVISEEMGREYARRFGDREFKIVTDGLTHVSEGPKVRPEKSLRLYFMGLFHFTYGPNARAVLDALALIRDRNPDWNITATFRSGGMSSPLKSGDVPVHVLPFASRGELEKDLLRADVLYQPLPLEAFAAKFARYSLSTKMISYLGSGLPIFYHGPKDAAAFQLLERHQAAQLCTTLDPESIARDLLDTISRRNLIVNNALALARSRFMLGDQQQRFWHPILESVNPCTSMVSA
jgi:hypothetical protein